jgi:hypothetical protein
MAVLYCRVSLGVSHAQNLYQSQHPKTSPACFTPPTHPPTHAAGVLTWRDCLEYSPAWDTLIWFAILISMSNGLNESGLISTFAGLVGQQLTALNLGWEVSVWDLKCVCGGGGGVWERAQ